jgi:hypothetical protein
VEISIDWTKECSSSSCGMTQRSESLVWTKALGSTVPI